MSEHDLTEPTKTASLLMILRFLSTIFFLGMTVVQIYKFLLDVFLISMFLKKYAKILYF